MKQYRLKSLLFRSMLFLVLGATGAILAGLWLSPTTEAASSSAHRAGRS